MVEQLNSMCLDLRESADVTTARHEFVAVLHRLLPNADLAAAELTVSELLANVQRHAPGPARLTLHNAHGRLILSVADHAPAFESPGGIPDPLSLDGRGLFLVSQLAGPISIDLSPDGWTTVTVTLPIETECAP